MTRTAPTTLTAYLATATLARSATESAGPALLIVAIATIGDPTTGTYLVSSLTASAAIGGPIIGALLDRTKSPRLGFAIAMITMAIGLSAVALTINKAPISLVMTFALIAGIGYPAITGALSAQVPLLVPGGSLRHAYASDAATYSIAAVAAPPAAAALIAVSSTAPLWLPVALLILTLILLRSVPLHASSINQPPKSLAEDLRAGFGTILHQVALRRTAIITTVGLAGQAAVFVAAPLLALSLTNSLQFTGVILGAFASGGVLTALWFARHPVARPDRAIIASMALSGLILLMIGLAPTTWILLIAAFAMGATEPPLVSGMFQVRQRESTQRLQSQVFTTSASLRMTAFAVSTAICGSLIPLGIWAVIAFGVLLHFLALILGIWAGPELPPRRHWIRRN